MGVKVYYIVEVIIFLGIGYLGLFQTKYIIKILFKGNEKYMNAVKAVGIVAIINAIMNLVNLFAAN